nr:MAG TPA: hypothetical protein [Caudoviricetes sp.]
MCYRKSFLSFTSIITSNLIIVRHTFYPYLLK